MVYYLRNILLVFLFLLQFQVVQAAYITDFSPISHWTCDETSGVREDSTITNDLTSNNSVASVTGLKNNACDFEFSSSQFLSISDASQSGLDITGDHTYSFWIKVESLPSDANYKLITKWGSSNGAYMLSYRNASGVPKLRLDLYEDGSNNVPVDWTYTFTTGSWYHVVVTVDVGVTDTVSTLYVNGSSQGQGTHSGINSIYSGSGAFNIGAYGGIDGFNDGVLDEITLSNTVWTSDNVTSVYNSGSPLDYTGAAPTSTPTSTPTTTSVSMDDTNFLLSIIIFFMTFLFLGFVFNMLKS